MTIKFRNRLNIGFICFSIFIFLVNISFFIHSLIVGNYTLPDFTATSSSQSFFLRYRIYYVFASIIFLMLYTIATSFYLWLGFEKTQSSEVIFILLFLASFIFDSVRLLIPFYYTKGPYSTFIFTLGNFIILSRILAPLSLLSLNVFTTEDERQNVERNLLMILVCATIFAVYIPLNTGDVYKNFAISYSFDKTIFLTQITINILTIFIMFLRQFNAKSSQILTFGYAMISFGYIVLFNTWNLLTLTAGIILTTTGTILYLGSLHKGYMFDM